MNYTTLIDPQTLYHHLDNPDWVVVDCRFNLADTGAGLTAYRTGHIPSARYAHLDDDLSSTITPTSGRHPLPDPDRLAATLSRWGIGNNSQVVAYDDVGGAMAGRLWWLLRWLGHERCAVLDGGLKHWQQAGLPLTDAEPESVTAEFTPKVDNRLWLSSEAVADSLEQNQALLIDARAPARFQGKTEPLDPVAGHVPGAINAPFDGNLDQQGRFRSPDELRQRFETLLAGKSPDQVLHMCGSGVTACHNLLAMEAAGLPGARLYAGSWSEWIRDPARPVARDD